MRVCASRVMVFLEETAGRETCCTSCSCVHGIPANQPGLGVLGGGRYGVLNRPECRSVRIGHEAQFALKESVTSTILTYVDEADTGERTRKERFDPPARGGIECVERAVHYQPLWSPQTDSREGQALLFVFVQAPVPTIGRVKK